MPIDPKAAQWLAEMKALDMPPVNAMSPAKGRQMMRDGSYGLSEVKKVRDVDNRRIPGPDGDIPVRIFHPPSTGRPILVYFHGGGWVLGGVDTHDAYCRLLCDAADVVVVSVDYRLAPEHLFPAASEDSYAATVWAAEAAAELGADPSAIMVAGDSAGGNLAAVVALMARDRSGPALTKQVLIYPITSDDVDTPSYQACADGYYLTREAMIWFWEQYCPDPDQRSHPYVSPLKAESLAGLPPALILTAEFDPLRDEGEQYGEQLRAAGVEVTISRYDGMIHGFVRRLRQFDQAKLALQEVADAIR